MLLVNDCATLLQQRADWHLNNGIMRWVKIGPIAFFLFEKLRQRNILSIFFAITYVTCEILEAISYLLFSQMIFNGI